MPARKFIVRLPKPAAVPMDDDQQGGEEPTVCPSPPLLLYKYAEHGHAMRPPCPASPGLPAQV